MTSSPRRPGFRLPWSGADAQTDAPNGNDDTPPAAADQDQPSPATDVPATDAPMTAGESEATATSSEPAPTAATTPPPVAPREPANPFLRSLVNAMRGVAEDARASSLNELKARVEQRVEHLAAAGSELAEDLRRRSELDIKGIGDWERGEIERIRGEAARKVEARRQQLEQQLTERQQTTEREIEQTRSRLADHERELAAFAGELAELDDPTAFVAAARRMPQPPSLELAHLAGERVEEESGTGTLSARLASLGVPGAMPPAPTSGDANGRSNGHVDEAEEATAIVVSGLGSFGAITSFKQSLEKNVGIRSVSLSLGPTGEFVYRAAHDPSFDIESAIKEVESGAGSIEREPDGTLRVTVIRPR